MFSFLWVYPWEGKLLRQGVTIDPFKELPACFPKGLARFTFPPLEEGSSFSFLSL